MFKFDYIILCYVAAICLMLLTKKEYLRYYRYEGYPESVRVPRKGTGVEADCTPLIFKNNALTR